MIDATKDKYKLVLEIDGIDEFILNDMVTECSWSDSESDAVGKMDITLVQKYSSRHKMYTDEIFSNYNAIKLYYEDTLINRYVIRNNSVRYNVGSNTVSVALYDRLYNLSKCEESWHYEAGKNTKEILEDIFRRAETELEFEYPMTTHDAIYTKAQAMLDEVSDVLDKAYTDSAAHKPILFMNGTKAFITERGYNADVYRFYRTSTMTDTGNIISFDRTASVENIVNRIQMFGKETSENVFENLGNVDGDISHEVIQNVKYVDGDKTQWDLKREALRILEENGSQKVTYTVTVPDVGYVRKGYKVKLELNENINDYFYVIAVTHNLANRTMNLTLVTEDDDKKLNISLTPEEEQAEAEYKKKQEEEKAKSESTSS